MATPLTNDRWGYASNCFVCEPGNEGGLQIPFQLDDDGATVSAMFTLGDTYSGAPALLHGGVSLAVLDEAQAWACIAIAGKWGLTASAAAEFDQPVFVDHTYRVEAEVTAATDARVDTAGQILGPQGDVLVRATAGFHVVGVVDIETGENALSIDPSRVLPPGA